MKTISDDLKSTIENEIRTIARLWKLTRQDGTIMGFTDHDEDIVYDGVTYEASSGVLSSALSQSSNLAVDNAEVMSFLNSDKITEEDILAKKYDYAELDVYEIDYEHPAYGVMTLASGWILGEVEIKDEQYTAEVRSKSQKLQQVIGSLYQPECRVELGDSKCMVDLKPSDWEGETTYAVGDEVSPTTPNKRIYECTVAGASAATEPEWPTTVGDTIEDGDATWQCKQARTLQGMVTAVTNNRVFFDTNTVWNATLATQDDYFNYGLLTWLTGDNADYEMEVKDWKYPEREFTLVEVMPYTIQVGDTFEVYPGCDKRLATCRDKWDNIDNFRGEPYTPGMDSVIDYGIPS